MSERKGKLTRVFAHVRVHGLDASVEARERPGQPVAVYDDAAQRVVSVSPAAFRQGVRPGASRWEAERCCPELLAVQPNPEKYEYFWQQVVEICGDYSPEVRTDRPVILRQPKHPRGLAEEDLALSTLSRRDISLDLTGTERLFGPPKRVAQEIRNRLRVEVGVVASVGVGPNAMVARLACEVAGPGKVVEVAPKEVADFVGRLPVAILPGVDREMAQQLDEMGIRQAKALAALPVEAVERAFEPWGRRIWEIAQGGDPEESRWEQGLISGLGSESDGETIAAQVDLHPPSEERERVRAGLRAAADELTRKLRERGQVAQQVRIELVFRDLRTVGARRTLRHPTRSAEVIFQAARLLFEHMKLHGRLVRRVRLRAARLTLGPQGGQMSLPLLEREARRERLLEMVEKLRDRFGEEAVTRGSVRELVPR